MHLQIPKGSTDIFPLTDLLSSPHLQQLLGTKFQEMRQCQKFGQD